MDKYGGDIVTQLTTIFGNKSLTETMQTAVEKALGSNVEADDEAKQAAINDALDKINDANKAWDQYKADVASGIKSATELTKSYENAKNLTNSAVTNLQQVKSDYNLSADDFGTDVSLYTNSYGTESMTAASLAGQGGRDWHDNAYYAVQHLDSTYGYGTVGVNDADESDETIYLMASGEIRDASSFLTDAERALSFIGGTRTTIKEYDPNTQTYSEDHTGVLKTNTYQYGWLNDGSLVRIWSMAHPLTTPIFIKYGDYFYEVSVSDAEFEDPTMIYGTEETEETIAPLDAPDPSPITGTKNTSFTNYTAPWFQSDSKEKSTEKNVNASAIYSSNALGTTDFQGGATLINELGTEAIVTPSGAMTSFPSYDSIVPSDIAQNLYNLGEIAPNLIQVATVHDLNSVTSNKNIKDNSMRVGALNAKFNVNNSFDFERLVQQAQQYVATTKNR